MRRVLFAAALSALAYGCIDWEGAVKECQAGGHCLDVAPDAGGGEGGGTGGGGGSDAGGGGGTGGGAGGGGGGGAQDGGSDGGFTLSCFPSTLNDAGLLCAQEFCWEQPRQPVNDLHDVQVTGGKLFAVGRRGVIACIDINSPTQFSYDVQTAGGRDLEAVYADKDGITVGGAAGTIAHFDGATWVPFRIAQPDDTADVQGLYSFNGSVIAAAENVCIGTTTTDLLCQTDPMDLVFPDTVAGRGSTVLVGGANGGIQVGDTSGAFNAAKLNVIQAPITGACIAENGQMWVGGGENGRAYLATSTDQGVQWTGGQANQLTAVKDIACDLSTEIWVAGDNSGGSASCLLCSPATGCGEHSVPQAFPRPYTVDVEGNETYVAGIDGMIAGLQRPSPQQDVWTRLDPVLAKSPGRIFHSVSAAPDGGAYATGSNCEVYRRTADARWVFQSLPVACPGEFKGSHVMPDGTVYFVGESFSVVRLDPNGSATRIDSRRPNGTQLSGSGLAYERIAGFGNVVFAVGDEATLAQLKPDGGFEVLLNSAAGSVSYTDVFINGTGLTTYFVGDPSGIGVITAGTALPTFIGGSGPTGDALSVIAAGPNSDVFGFAGSVPFMLRSDAGSYTQPMPGTVDSPSTITDLIPSGANFYATDVEGLIFRVEPTYGNPGTYNLIRLRPMAATELRSVARLLDGTFIFVGDRGAILSGTLP